MSRLTDYDRRIKQYEAAAQTAGALGDVNALRMQAIRRKFEKNQVFFDEIRALYGIVRTSAERVKREGAPHIERVLYIAVTANRRFAGTLARDTIDALARELTTNPSANCLVIGRLGWQYLDTLGLAPRGRQVLFAGESPTSEEFVSLINYASAYDKVFVLYGRFVNAFRQEVAMQEITETPEATGQGEELYLFEPEVEAMRAFFDAQVRYILFERVLLESDIARTAARFVTMEEARERASELLDTERMHRMREVAAAGNAALLETFAGYARWFDDDHAD